MRPMTISQLERETGVGRSTIYFYISEGLLPPAQKASATRAIYSRSHLELLNEINRLKTEGLSLKEIAGRLADRIEAASEITVDLVAKQNEDTRNAILQTAARFFTQRGYEETRISDICREVGVTAQLLYSHFPSKRHLFIACFEVYFKWMNVRVAGPIEQTADSSARMAWRVWAGLGMQALSRDLQAMARVEAFHRESELNPLVRDVYEKMLAGSSDELAADRKADANPGLFDDELVSHGLLGALENMLMRVSWDDKYNRYEVMKNVLAIFLSVRAAYAGRVDLTEDWARIAGLAEGLVASVPRPAEAPMAPSQSDE